MYFSNSDFIGLSEKAKLPFIVAIGQECSPIGSNTHVFFIYNLVKCRSHRFISRKLAICERNLMRMNGLIRAKLANLKKKLIYNYLL